MTEIIAQPKRDEAALLQLLSDAQARAKSQGHPTLVSISLEVDFLDPLAVLESIWERSEWHAYFENVAEEFAFAGAESVCKAEFSGPNRCEEAEKWVESILGYCIESGDTDHPYSGPQIMVGMTFSDKASSAFAPMTVWVPRWQVLRVADQTIAVANAQIEADTDIEAVALRMMRAHGRFAEFKYSEAAARTPSLTDLKQDSSQKEDYTHGVSAALKDIELGRFKKIVLARSETFRSKTPLSPIGPMSRMREAFWGCHCFAFGNDQGTSFIGATPEILFKKQGDILKTQALAGSISRAENARDDADLGSALLHSEKDLHEHELVREAIVRRLKGIGVDVLPNKSPKLLKLKNIQHLNTPLSGNTGGRASFWSILNALHPTPAVGGSPREVTAGLLDQYETLDRSLYAGAIGMVNRQGDGKMHVAIRSVSVSEHTMEFFAGAGIVAGSDPEKEWEETQLKMNAMRDIFNP
ncbi:MAG: isochorismate synthase [Opitutales bacterium]